MPSTTDHMIALGAHFEVLGHRANATVAAFTTFAQTMQRSVAASVRKLSRAQRAEYWRLRKTGKYPLDVLHELR